MFWSFPSQTYSETGRELSGSRRSPTVGQPPGKSWGTCSAWPGPSPALRYVHPLSRRGPTSNLAVFTWPRKRAAAQANSGQDQAELMRRLEAVLFLAKEPLNTRKLSRYANLADGTQARTLVGQLNRQYDETGRSFRVEEVAGGFQLRTRAVFSRWLRRTPHVPAETRLSAPSLETLAVVAYRQPVVRADIESVRGVACGEILRQLMDRDLVRVSGRSNELGRPYFYSTTKRFLEVFGLRNLDELPRAEEFELGLATSDPAPTAGAPQTDIAVATPPRAEDEDEDEDEWEDEEEWDDDDEGDEEEDGVEGDEEEEEEWEDDDEWEEVEDDEVEEGDEEEEDEEWEEEWDDDEELDDEELDDEELDDDELDDDELDDDELEDEELDDDELEDEELEDEDVEFEDEEEFYESGTG